jgi:hypothetical protein
MQVPDDPLLRENLVYDDNDIDGMPTKEHVKPRHGKRAKGDDVV